MTDMEPVKCEKLLADNYVGHLAYIADNEPHVVPSTYFFDEDRKCILCFASNGHPGSFRIESLLQVILLLAAG